MDVYEIAKQYLGGTIASEGILAQKQCTATCVITIPAEDVVKNCKIQCLNATTRYVKVRYSFDLKKGAKVKAVVRIYKGGRLVGRGEWVHETPGWCWALPTDWCGINEEREIYIRNVNHGDRLTVRFEVYK